MRLGLGIGINRAVRRGATVPGPTNTVAPAVTGTAKVGSVLTVSNGTWTGNGTITYAYQWLRNGSNIASATASTYTLVTADDLTTVSCRVTATDLDGSRAATSNGVAVTQVAPVNTVAPVASGSTTLGSVLSVTNGTWTGNSISYTYQWQRGGVNISGQTANTYTIVQADDAAAVRCVVTATNSGGGVSANSNAITVDDFAAPVITGVPTISGTTTEGQTLTASAASVTGNPTPTRTWQWRRNGTNISGATSSTYLLVTADVGTVISVRQTETNSQGSDNEVSANTATIAAAASLFDPATIFPAGITGYWAPVTASELWRDEARTLPVTTDGQAVASWLQNTADGEIVYFTQSNPDSRFIYRTSGGIEWLELDGVDDFMVGPAIGENTSYQVFVCVRPTSVTGTRNIIDCDGGSGRMGQLIRIDGDIPQSIAFASGTPITDSGPTVSINTDTVISAIGTSGASVDVRKDGSSNGATSTGLTFAGGLDQPINIGRNGFGGSFFQGRIYGHITRVGPSLTSGEIADAEAWAAAQANP